MVSILTRIGHNVVVLAGILPFTAEDPDHVSPTSEIVKEIIANNKKKTGWERVRAIFELDEFDNLSMELTTVLQGSTLGAFIGACYGGWNRSQVAYLDFVTKNQASQFRSHFDAKKKLQDQVTIGMAKGGFRWGWRLGYFTGTYLLVSNVVSAYRGEVGILEYVIGGVVTGGLYKCNMGLRGIAVGSGLGGVLGGIAGLCTYSLIKVTGYSMEEIMYWRKNWRDSRKRLMNEALSPYGGVNEDPLVKEYIARHEKGGEIPKGN
ncbi:complex I assembly factor TIMMDC1, mitochondrial [Hetaerina americana]|uniref:complex I assembly factor TIMMDC1, mitochondrial n=1 Tax=Hetaerina americana TaxID=62018 RepID=UPI003A7F3A6C